ncbi:hypothetical protein CH373_04450 [Leptospira perolatii]|uniref:Lipoprotein n=1 Tax=Leptospira perolatii TaxID=2023191 RepID=A0A2M9ZQG8_9LEPT|nr:hypothetical protein [Leptospira perolatii]PJZ68248.1 hypothetical protein CH360_17175 [Leptospira perolatii]PJZ74173.1 hypothetical protein CH373_04450 [Leptospira perolatii]
MRFFVLVLLGIGAVSCTFSTKHVPTVFTPELRFAKADYTIGVETSAKACLWEGQVHTPFINRTYHRAFSEQFPFYYEGVVLQNPEYEGVPIKEATLAETNQLSTEEGVAGVGILGPIGTFFRALADLNIRILTLNQVNISNETEKLESQVGYEVDKNTNRGMHYHAPYTYAKSAMNIVQALAVHRALEKVEADYLVDMTIDYQDTSFLFFFGDVCATIKARGVRMTGPMMASKESSGSQPKGGKKGR